MRTPSDKTITIDVDLNQTIADLKAQIEEKEGLDKSIQALQYAGKKKCNGILLLVILVNLQHIASIDYMTGQYF